MPPLITEVKMGTNKKIHVYMLGDSSYKDGNGEEHWFVRGKKYKVTKRQHQIISQSCMLVQDMPKQARGLSHRMMEQNVLGMR